MAVDFSGPISFDMVEKCLSLRTKLAFICPVGIAMVASAEHIKRISESAKQSRAQSCLLVNNEKKKLNELRKFALLVIVNISLTRFEAKGRAWILLVTYFHLY